MVSFSLEWSSWSHTDQIPTVIGDLTNEETFTYLHRKLGIEEKVVYQLIQLLGGQICDLKTYGAMINKGMAFEGEKAFTITISGQ